jgi:hypothetical protein
MAATSNCRRAVLSTLRPDMKPIAAPSESAAMAPMITEATTAPAPRTMCYPSGSSDTLA